MKAPVITCLLAALALGVRVPPAGAAGKNGLRDPALQRLYRSLRSPAIAQTGWYTDTLRLHLPDFRVTLIAGRLAPLQDSIAGCTGLLFEGQAHVEFHPRDDAEQFQLVRFTKDSVITGTTNHLLLRFPHAGMLQTLLPDTAIFARLPHAPAIFSRPARELADNLQALLLERRGYNLAAHLLRSRLQPVITTQVVCAFSPERDLNPFPPLYIYIYDAAAVEQVAFLQYFHKRVGRPLFTVCSYAVSADSTAPRPALLRYNGWIQLSQNGMLEADMGVNLLLPQQKPPAFHFALAADLEIAWILSEDGDTLSFVREKKEGEVTVFVEQARARGDTLRLLFHYKGELLRRHDNGMYALKDAVFWVPRLGYLQRAHYNIVYKCPPRLRVLTLGHLVRDWEEAGFHLSYYRTHAPAKASTFCLGSFNADTVFIPGLGLPPIEIYSSARHTPGTRKRVAADVANSLYFFASRLGEYRLPVLRVVEVPTFHSQGFPGFVTLSWLGFSGHAQGPREALRSHEIAHQWFGNTLGWATYHDQWLSEAFAEYLGALYVEWVLRDKNHFTEILQAWSNDLLEQGNVGVSIGMQRFGFSKEALRKSEGLRAGPIAMGVRLGQREALDYYMQTYEKGAYVLHMLRWLLRDLDTGDDSRFWNLLADFLRVHRDGEPATRDFQRLAEQHYGAPLTDFFRQWIHHNHVPRYHWRHEIITVPATLPAGLPVARPAPSSGKPEYIVRVHVRQQDVPPDFNMPVPVTVEYADGFTLTRRVQVSHEGGLLEFPAYPARVSRVVFNTGNAVLCRISPN
ncbi:MAG: M1 family aminopeptidase [candidate division KSB1 bacterium]|nr:M1 family aminopeptidase [candidate division KSB1 bacterium]MDZ7274595.1 M1 family aminopeptidase [candidate division KSB1 bacterium]MDZ7284744.1 M1 family aminopeptidase [candidate division KSB1 bacterium]MDZ7297836.1 M1 family aminopeptidase [candidate division KSB1 bacterium]MDZ7308877.1 M1 family aminopeptidase [candidate division KSB1 bacterium]